MDEQLLRVVLPTRLLTEIDQHLASEGSSRTRTEFVREAVEQRLLELRFGATDSRVQDAERTKAPSSSPLPQPPLASEEVDLSDDPLVCPESLVDTRLPGPASATVVHPDTVGFPVEPGPLFLHGRDYPSFWCLWWLARWADEGPLELSHYLNEITRAAWNFAEHLQDYDRAGELRATTMFPTSTRNRDSASQTFQTSAVGGLIRRRDGSQVAVGPLAHWSVARIYAVRDRVLIAPTQLGLDLLGRLEGLSLELPHSAEHASVFLEHLREHADEEFADFQKVLGVVAEEPNREDLVAALAQARLGGTKKLADVYAQAYVSRGREWGLIEPRLIAGRYRLTERASKVRDG